MELLLGDGFLLPLKHSITNLTSGTCIFSFHFVLLRTVLPSRHTVCQYQCNCLGSAVASQLSQNQNMVRNILTVASQVLIKVLCFCSSIRIYDVRLKSQPSLNSCEFIWFCHPVSIMGSKKTRQRP